MSRGLNDLKILRGRLSVGHRNLGLTPHFGCGQDANGTVALKLRGRGAAIVGGNGN